MVSTTTCGSAAAADVFRIMLVWLLDSIIMKYERVYKVCCVMWVQRTCVFVD